MAKHLKKAQQLNNPLLDYLESVLKTLTTYDDSKKGVKKARQELLDAIELMNPSHAKSNKPRIIIIFPYPGDSISESIDRVHKMMDQYLNKYRDLLMVTQDQIDLQELIFQQFKEKLESRKFTHSSP